MSRKFRTPDYESALNEAITLREALPPNHLARFVVMVIGQLDLSHINTRYAQVGGEAITPEILLGLLFYGYATGVFSSRKLEKAWACGIDFVINTAREDLNTAILRDFGPNRADLILECVGAQATATQAVECARKGTTVVIVGVFGEKSVVNLGFVQDRELNLIGTAMYQKIDYEGAIELVTSSKMHLDELLTHRFAFEDYLQAYQTIEQSNGEYMKVMIELDYNLSEK
jgi:hypothetical protein